MNKFLRVFLVLLALVLCALPLVACDSESDTDADDTPKVPGVATDIPEDSYEDKVVVKFPSNLGDYYLTFNQLTAPEGDLVGVSLCYYATDGTLLDSVEFYYENGGRDCTTDDLYKVLWGGDGSAIATVNDEAKTQFTLRDKR